ncbi:2-desacetyl-2-hydroxyethyl bacteriochlorophyllide A dehydrogenase [Picrophilus oshimae DSM 9789]|uniref:2-desacetyl-2-hydroxyethyl bacteriochlorophyllide A dehydrogenase n=2 Tax=Picrophilus oshimae TaxID=46632 RepID=A0A8G2L7W9_PICTO|nr:2-desacetyl-2-hydroxyethyl bacteriochlorophyllide A dehydrogenase [Picrophilus oshimae DSM 9789]
MQTKTLVWTDIKKMELKEKSIENPEPGWVTVKVNYAGICGSELSAFVGQNELRKPPSVMGHEFSGTVIKTGSDKDSYLLNRNVAVNPLVTCGKCRYCRTGNRQLCPERKIIGIDYPGGFAEYVNVPAYSCYEIIDIPEASLAEPLATALRAVNHAHPAVGDKALVIGAGTIGLLSLKILEISGTIERTVADINDYRLEHAMHWGATKKVNNRNEVIEKGDFDIVVDAVGTADTRKLALDSVARGGRVVYVGLHEPETEFQVNYIIRNEINIHGSFCYSDDDFRRAVDLINNGFLNVKEKWYDIRPIDSGEDSFNEELSPDSKYSKIIMKP